MNKSLLEQLDRYGSYTEERQSPVSVAEIIKPAPETLVAPPIPPRRRWVGALAGAAVVVVVLGGVGLLVGEGDEAADPTTPTSAQPPVTSAPATDPPEPSTIASIESAPVAFGAQGWQLLTVPSDVFGTERFMHMSEIIGYDGGLIAVGTIADARRWPIVWRSDDGVGWERVFVGSGEDNVMAVISGGSRLVAVGGHRYLGSTPVWASVDGADWTETRSEHPDFRDVIFAGGRFIAVAGYSHEPSSEARQFESPLLYESTDGVTWTGIPRANLEQPRSGRVFELNAIATDGDRVVVYGEIARGDFRYSGFWISEDGVRWSLASTHPALCCQVYPLHSYSNLLAGGPKGFVSSRVWTSGEDNNDVLLFSADGSTWEVVLNLDETTGTHIYGVTATDQGFVAVGFDHRLDRGVIWTSADGLNWTWVSRDLSFLDKVFLEGVWAIPNGLIAVGSHADIRVCGTTDLPDCPPVIITWTDE